MLVQFSLLFALVYSDCSTLSTCTSCSEDTACSWCPGEHVTTSASATVSSTGANEPTLTSTTTLASSTSSTIESNPSTTTTRVTAPCELINGCQACTNEASCCWAPTEEAGAPALHKCHPTGDAVFGCVQSCSFRKRQQGSVIARCVEKDACSVESQECNGATEETSSSSPTSVTSQTQPELSGTAAIGGAASSPRPLGLIVGVGVAVVVLCAALILFAASRRYARRRRHAAAADATSSPTVDGRTSRSVSGRHISRTSRSRVHRGPSSTSLGRAPVGGSSPAQHGTGSTVPRYEAPASAFSPAPTYDHPTSPLGSH